MEARESADFATLVNNHQEYNIKNTQDEKVKMKKRSQQI